MWWHFCLVWLFLPNLFMLERLFSYCTFINGRIVFLNQCLNCCMLEDKLSTFISLGITPEEKFSFLATHSGPKWPFIFFRVIQVIQPGNATLKVHDIIKTNDTPCKQFASIDTYWCLNVMLRILVCFFFMVFSSVIDFWYGLKTVVLCEISWVWEVGFFRLVVLHFSKGKLHSGCHTKTQMKYSLVPEWTYCS